jgi:hypothetical protein
MDHLCNLSCLPSLSSYGPPCLHPGHLSMSPSLCAIPTFSPVNYPRPSLWIIPISLPMGYPYLSLRLLSLSFSLWVIPVAYTDCYCITGNKSWLSVFFPRHKNFIVENIWLTAVTCKIWTFLAVRQVDLMTHDKCRVDHPFTDHMIGVGWEPSPPPPTAV